jgi:hypothetical protein
MHGLCQQRGLADRITNSYSVRWRMWKCGGEFFGTNYTEEQPEHCYHVVAKQTTENSVWFWFKNCWKWVQGNLILNPPQQEDQTHKPDKWQAQKLDTLSTGQLQNCTCGVMRAQKRTNHYQIPEPQVQGQPVCSPYLGLYYTEVNFWIRLTLQHGKDTISKKCKSYTFYYNIFFYFRIFKHYFWK